MYSGSGQSFDRGKTLHDGQTPPATTPAGTLGIVKEFPDKDRSTGGTGADSLRSGSMVTCKLVKNSSGIALLPGYIVKYKASTKETEVDGYTNVTNERGAGVVDEWLPAAGVPDNDVFWIVVEGPTLLKTSLAADAENVFTEGEYLGALAAATSQATTAGRPVGIDIGSTTGTTAIVSGLANKVGYALSAATTANTNSDLLAYVQFRR